METQLKLNKKLCEKEKIIFFLGVLLLSLFIPFSAIQAQSEIPTAYFTKFHGTEVAITSEVNLNKLLKQDGINIDHGSTIERPVLYVTLEGYNYLLKKEISFEWIGERPSQLEMMNLKAYKDMRTQKGDCLEPLTKYLEYEAYEQMMLDFEILYPEICKVVNIATLNSGRKILAVQISDNLDTQEHEPNFLYTSTMHGDELAGFPTMLMLIDHLLCNYGSDAKITNLVNNVNIYINPLANPNGTYKGGNGSVLESIRLNDAFVDLNRNFPDPDNGPNPDNNPHQEETIAFMDFAEEKNIHISCNIHSGKEFCNYPWDTYEHLHADDAWWQTVCRSYADTVQANSTDGYFTDYNNGISNGFISAEISGSRQDYMNYYRRAKEFTLELTDTKTLLSHLLPDVWEANRSALLNFLEQSLYGISGTIRDCETLEPIIAEVFIPLHDKDNSSVFSNKLDGSYFRYIKEGTYDITVRSEDYIPTMTQLEVVDNKLTTFDVTLCKDDVSTDDISGLSDIKLSVWDNKLILNNKELNNELYIQMSSINGSSLLNVKTRSRILNIPDNLAQGIYLVTLGDGDQFYTHKVFVK